SRCSSPWSLSIPSPQPSPEGRGGMRRLRRRREKCREVSCEGGELMIACAIIVVQRGGEIGSKHSSARFPRLIRGTAFGLRPTHHDANVK
ncbi:MAG: hypothetical protein ACODAQ_03860, partial [Phycisphaeraceae bacterium]